MEYFYEATTISDGLITAYPDEVYLGADMGRETGPGYPFLPQVYRAPLISSSQNCNCPPPKSFTGANPPSHHQLDLRPRTRLAHWRRNQHLRKLAQRAPQQHEPAHKLRLHDVTAMAHSRNNQIDQPLRLRSRTALQLGLFSA